MRGGWGRRVAKDFTTTRIEGNDEGDEPWRIVTYWLVGSNCE